MLAALGAGRVLGADLPRGCELGVTPISGPLGLADVVLRAPAELGAAAVVRVEKRGGAGVDVPMRMEAVAGSRPAAVMYSARVMAGVSGGVGAGADQITFSISLFDAGGAPAEVGRLGPFTVSAAPRAGCATPDWAKGAVWYQVFAERYRNANPANDPRGPENQLMEWTADWHAIGVDEIEAARARGVMSPPHEQRAMPNPRSAAMQARRYGGDLQGLVEKLDELADLGVTAIYLNPVFDAHSHHKYDATDFRHIDPSLGSADGARPRIAETEDAATWEWTAADRFVLDTLLPAVHEREMRIVFDGVWNHVGTRFWAFADVMEKGRRSRFAPWFQGVFAEDEPEADPRLRGKDVKPGALVGWASWNSRNGSLPTFSRDAAGRLHEEVEAHIFEVTRRWMAPQGPARRGIDGWRLDVAPDLPRPFWEAWCAHARAVNPDALLIGEFWFDARDYMSTGDAPAVFDGQMNYPMAMPVVRWLGDARYSASRLGAQLAPLLSRPPQHELVQMNMLTSHDTARLATMLAAGSAGVSEYNAATPARLRGKRPGPEVYDRVVLGVALQTAWPGAPMVYYGDEYGMHGENDPHCRKPLPWADRGEMVNPADSPEAGLRSRFRAWLRLRSHPAVGAALRLGDCRIIDTGAADVFAFERSLNDQRVLLVANRGDTAFDAAELVGRAAGVRGLVRLPVGDEGAAQGAGAMQIPARSAGVFH